VKIIFELKRAIQGMNKDWLCHEELKVEYFMRGGFRERASIQLNCSIGFDSKKMSSTSLGQCISFKHLVKISFK
jgi:hypothetical protein